MSFLDDLLNRISRVWSGETVMPFEPAIRFIGGGAAGITDNTDLSTTDVPLANPAGNFAGSSGVFEPDDKTVPNAYVVGGFLRQSPTDGTGSGVFLSSFTLDFSVDATDSVLLQVFATAGPVVSMSGGVVTGPGLRYRSGSDIVVSGVPYAAVEISRWQQPVTTSGDAWSGSATLTADFSLPTVNPGDFCAIWLAVTAVEAVANFSLFRLNGFMYEL